ncbi:IclR family transcriptional regulator [Roseiarcaceae bacterium H3SJ34-1]|uniref:IclR family transcriptional regulator n=1 Tax=Terripilifer ovatus TaxID=3032367 RepID=UPI003AB94374|nr:IclR family transcriptional regulator [Roseiarcaceae bacterium H3SJ34-1]
MPRAIKRKEGASSIRAVDRALEILKLFQDGKASKSIMELQSASGLSRPTLYRLLDTLAAHRFIRMTGLPQRFSLDYAVGQLAQSWLAGLDLTTVARPILERLHERTEETVSLAMLQGSEAIYAVELVSPQILSMSRGVGPIGPLVQSASGKSILAHLSEDVIQAEIKASSQHVDGVALRKALAKIRKDGFCIARGEVIKGVVAVAAPYFKSGGAVAGAIVIFGPEVRMTSDRTKTVSRAVVAAAAEISSAMGQSPAR